MVLENKLNITDQVELNKAARKSIIHSNRAGIKKSDMMKKINAMK